MDKTSGISPGDLGSQQEALSIDPSVEAASGIRLKSRGRCRGGPPWPHNGPQITLLREPVALKVSGNSAEHH
jgi:hypothetical protein